MSILCMITEYRGSTHFTFQTVRWILNTFYLIDTAEANAQSDAERKACDTSEGKCIKVKNENNDVQPAGDGPRQRTSNKKQNLGSLLLNICTVCILQLWS